MIVSRLWILLLITIGLAFAETEETFIAMRDGVKLATDLYFPEGSRKDLPVVLERLPYNKKVLASRGAYFAARGYVFAAQDVRGRFRSEGRFEPFVREGPDGYDSIEWLARQPWSSGKVGTIGASYGALAQWQTALLRPPHLAAMVVSGSPMDRVAFENGIFALWNFAAWLNIIYRQKPEDDSPLDAMKLFHSDFPILPVVDQDLKAFGRVDEVWRRWCSEPSDADYWQPMRILSRMDRITIPVLHQSGWFDGGSLATKHNYLALAKVGAKNQRLIIGPWEH